MRMNNLQAVIVNDKEIKVVSEIRIKNFFAIMTSILYCVPLKEKGR